MKGILDDLVSLLRLERLDRDLFRGRSQDLGWGAIFGGQVVGQALSAAAQTVDGGRIVHSLHGYFMRAGDVRGSIIYQIDRLRDGKSFTTRRVVAVQEGEAIFSLEASFQSDEDGLDHQDAMPEVPAPDTLKSEREPEVALRAQRLRLGDLGHRVLVVEARLVGLERRLEAEDRLALLDRDDAPGGEALAVAQAIDLVDDRAADIAGAHEVAVQRVDDPPAADGLRRRGQRLSDHLPAEDRTPAEILAAAAEQVAVDALEAEQ